MLTATNENITGYIPDESIPDCSFELLELHYMELIRLKLFAYAQEWAEKCIAHLEPLAQSDIDAYIVCERLRERCETDTQAECFGYDFTVEVYVNGPKVGPLFDHPTSLDDLDFDTLRAGDKRYAEFHDADLHAGIVSALDDLDDVSPVFCEFILGEVDMVIFHESVQAKKRLLHTLAHGGIALHLAVFCYLARFYPDLTLSEFFRWGIE